MDGMGAFAIYVLPKLGNLVKTRMEREMTVSNKKKTANKKRIRPALINYIWYDLIIN